MKALEAVRAAKEVIRDLYIDERIEELGLEELELCKNRPGVWQVTIGFRRVSSTKGPFSGLDPANNRIYKKVLIRNSDGEFISLKNRDVSS